MQYICISIKKNNHSALPEHGQPAQYDKNKIHNEKNLDVWTLSHYQNNCIGKREQGINNR